MRKISIRRWLPHFTPLCAGLLVIAAFVLRNVPGERHDQYSRVHGWPVTFLERAPTQSTAAVRIINTRVPDIWSLTEDVEQFYPGMLFADVAIALGAGALTTAVLQWWRRRQGTLLRFSLRTAAIAVLLCALPLGWLRYRVVRWHERRSTVQYLQENNADIKFELLLPEWLHNLLPDDLGYALSEVEGVYLVGSNFTDDDLKLLKDLPEVRTLSVQLSRVTSQGLAHIRHLDLEWLVLEESQVDSDGLAALNGMHRMWFLSLDGTRVGDAGLSHLRELRGLVVLTMQGCPVTDDGIQQLSSLPQLSAVVACNCSLSQAAADRLQANAPRLTTISIQRLLDYPVPNEGDD